jgi:hypothetical protein
MLACSSSSRFRYTSEAVTENMGYARRLASGQADRSLTVWYTSNSQIRLVASRQFRNGILVSGNESRTTSEVKLDKKKYMAY